MKSVRERMDINDAYREVGTYRGAADICGTTHKTVKRVIEAAGRVERGGRVVHNYDSVRAVVADRVARSQGRITAKRLLPVAEAAGYEGSARNFRRLVAEAKAGWRVDHHRGRRPGVWAPGDVLAFDWGQIGPLFVFCAVLAWSRWRFVSFNDNLGSDATELPPAGGTRGLRGLLCVWLTVVGLPFGGRDVAEAGMESARVVPVDPDEDGSAGLGPGSESVAVNEFSFQR